MTLVTHAAIPVCFCSLSGVPLAYDNIRIVGHQGDIYDDNGYIHMNIEASFIVFQPKKGQKILVGVIYTLYCY